MFSYHCFNCYATFEIKTLFAIELGQTNSGNFHGLWKQSSFIFMAKMLANSSVRLNANSEDSCGLLLLEPNLAFCRRKTSVGSLSASPRCLSPLYVHLFRSNTLRASLLRSSQKNREEEGDSTHKVPKHNRAHTLAYNML